MLCVEVELRRYVDDHQPGWVECWLTDANGQDWSFIEKVPVVTDEYLDSQSHFPRRGVIACQVVERQFNNAGHEIVIIDTQRPWGVEAVDGTTRFAIRSADLVEIPGL